MSALVGFNACALAVGVMALGVRAYNQNTAHQQLAYRVAAVAFSLLTVSHFTLSINYLVYGEPLCVMPRLIKMLFEYPISTYFCEVLYPPNLYWHGTCAFVSAIASIGCASCTQENSKVGLDSIQSRKK